jgi:hypothetical protein
LKVCFRKIEKVTSCKVIYGQAFNVEYYKRFMKSYVKESCPDNGPKKKSP